MFALISGAYPQHNHPDQNFDVFLDVTFNTGDVASGMIKVEEGDSAADVRGKALDFVNANLPGGASAPLTLEELYAANLPVPQG